MARTSFLSGLEDGDAIAAQGFDEYRQQKEYQDRLTQRAEDKQAQRNQAATTNYYKSKELGLEQDKLDIAKKGADAEADLRKSQKDLFDAEAEAIRSGKGRYGVGGSPKTPVDLLQANKNLESARKAISAYTVGGQKPPDELQDNYHAALADVDRLSQGLGLLPAVPKTGVTNNAPVDSGLHPIDSTMAWFKKIAGGAADASSGGDTVDIISGGQRHTIYKKNLDAARQRDPGLTVAQ